MTRPSRKMPSAHPGVSVLSYSLKSASTLARMSVGPGVGAGVGTGVGAAPSVTRASARTGSRRIIVLLSFLLVEALDLGAPLRGQSRLLVGAPVPADRRRPGFGD